MKKYLSILVLLSVLNGVGTLYGMEESEKQEIEEIEKSFPLMDLPIEVTSHIVAHYLLQSDLYEEALSKIKQLSEVHNKAILGTLYSESRKLLHEPAAALAYLAVQENEKNENWSLLLERYEELRKRVNNLNSLSAIEEKFDKSEDVAKILFAAAKGDKELVEKLLIKDSTLINATNNDRRTVLMIAARNGNLEVAQYLVEHKANINDRDDKGRTVLMYAVEKRHIEMIRFLVNDCKANLNAIDVWGRTALIIAAENGHLEVIWFLINSYKADVNTRDYFGKTILMYASGHIGVVRFLIDDCNLDVNAKDNEDCTTLMHAAESGHLEAIKFLIEKGANVNAQNKYGSTALMAAAQQEHLEIVKFLIENGADVTIKNVNDETAFDLARTEEIKMWLLMYSCVRGNPLLLEAIQEFVVSTKKQISSNNSNNKNN